MKNLKRILSLALACTMLIGMMVVGANAANFSDADDIQHTEAVETLVALGAISGNGDGAFDPEGPFTRAAMAKMLAWTMNKGKDPTFADTDNPTFTDVSSPAYKWAIPYIEYCYQLGYVSGDGGKGSTFRPGDAVKSTEFARALLNAMGYKLESNENWDLKTEVQARDENINLYEDLEDAIAGKPMTRDDAMQMMYNALSAPMADADKTSETVYKLLVSNGSTQAARNLNNTEYSSASDAQAVATSHNLKPYGTLKDESDWAVPGTPELLEDDVYSIIRSEHDTTETLGMKFLGLKKNEDLVLTTVKYDKDNKVYKLNGGSQFVMGEDMSHLIGHTVTVLYKEVKKNGTTTYQVYGLVDNSTVLAEGNVGQLTDATTKSTTITATTEKITLGGKTLTLNDENPVYVYELNTDTNTALTGFSGSDWHKLVAISDDGKTVARLVTTPVQYSSVGYVGTTQISVTGVDTYNTDEVTAYTGIAKGDQVLVTPKDNTADGKALIEEAPITEAAKVDAVRGSNEIRVNGTYYTVGGDLFDTLKKLGTYDVVIVNGYIVDAWATNTGSDSTVGVSDTFMVLATDTMVNASAFRGTAAYYPTRILTAAGEITEINVAKIGTSAVSSDLKPANNTLYTGKADSKGNYTLTAVSTGSKWSGLDASAQGGNAIQEGKYTNTKPYRFNDDAVIFLFTDAKGFEYEVVSGAQLNKWRNVAVTAAGSYVWSKDKSGFPYIALAVLNLGSAENLPELAADDNWGWILSDAVYTIKNKVGALEIEIWDGTAKRTIVATGLADGSDITSGTPGTFAKGEFITFEEDDDGNITGLDLLSGMNADAVIGLNGDLFKLQSGTTNVEYDLNDLGGTGRPWHVMYIDTKNNKGVGGGDIRIANKSDLGDYVENVYANATTGYLVVDVNNVLAKLSTEVIFPTTKDDTSTVRDFNDARTEITIYANQTAKNVTDKVKGWAGAGVKNAKVISATGATVADAAPVVAGDVLQITTQSGRLYSLKIKIQGTVTPVAITGVTETAVSGLGVNITITPDKDTAYVNRDTVTFEIKVEATEANKGDVKIGTITISASSGTLGTAKIAKKAGTNCSADGEGLEIKITKPGEAVSGTFYLTVEVTGAITMDQSGAAAATVNLGAVPTISGKTGYTFSYSKATPQIGEEFEVTLVVSEHPSAEEVIEVTYNDVKAELTVATDGTVTGTAKFIAAEGKTTATAKIKGAD